MSWAFTLLKISLARVYNAVEVHWLMFAGLHSAGFEAPVQQSLSKTFQHMSEYARVVVSNRL